MTTLSISLQLRSVTIIINIFISNTHFNVFSLNNPYSWSEMYVFLHEYICEGTIDTYLCVIIVLQTMTKLQIDWFINWVPSNSEFGLQKPSQLFAAFLGKHFRTLVFRA